MCAYFLYRIFQMTQKKQNKTKVATFCELFLNKQLNFYHYTFSKKSYF